MLAAGCGGEDAVSGAGDSGVRRVVRKVLDKSACECERENGESKMGCPEAALNLFPWKGEGSFNAQSSGNAS